MSYNDLLFIFYSNDINTILPLLLALRDNKGLTLPFMYHGLNNKASFIFQKMNEF